MYQEGRAGRDGRQCAVIILVGKKKRADKALARVFRTGNHCLREGVTNIFTLTKANGKYFKVRLKI